MKNDYDYDRLIKTVTVGFVLGIGAVWLFMGYIVYHFISKLW